MKKNLNLPEGVIVIKTSEGILKVETMERSDGHIDIVLTAAEKNSWPMLDHLNRILLGTYPKPFHTSEIIANVKEVQITIPTEKEAEENNQQQIALYPHPIDKGF